MKHLRKYNEQNSEKWAIFSGLGGGFGGANFIEVFTGSKREAEMTAHQHAVEEYESMAGMHGLRSIEEIMDEDGVDQTEADQIFNEEMESWLDYHVEPYDPNKEYE